VDVTWTRKRPRKEETPTAEIGRQLGFSKNAVIGLPGEPQFGASSGTEFAIGKSRKVRRRGSPGMSCGRLWQPRRNSFLDLARTGGR
jgi:hypothetical protein